MRDWPYLDIGALYCPATIQSVRVVIQRVSRAGVTVDGAEVAKIGRGLLLLVGIEAGDAQSDVELAAAKVASMRIFPDAEGKMNLSVEEIYGEILVVSQFTLLGEVARGRRPSFSAAASPAEAEPLVGVFATRLGETGLRTVSGSFGTHMMVDLVNDGPVTLLLEVTQGRVVS